MIFSEIQFLSDSVFFMPNLDVIFLPGPGVFFTDPDLF